MASKPPVLIITGYGVNCEAESRYAWELAGAAPTLLHLHDWLADPARVLNYKVLMFIGGFSFGDHMGSGHVFALRIRHRLREPLQQFIDSKGLILGVCNGFQVMVKLGLLPGLDNDYFTPQVALMHNDCGQFQNFWVGVGFEPQSPCVFSKGLTLMPLPIRHGEGKIFTPDKALLQAIEDHHCVACRYVDCKGAMPTQQFPDNPNGSLNAIAGLCDPTGHIFGLMPHPEAYLFPENHPNWQLQNMDSMMPDTGQGLRLFENAVEYLNA